MRSSIVALMILVAAHGPALAAEQSGRAFDWGPWQGLPVQDGGRQKPLDTLARETLRRITDRTRFADPETRQKLGPVAFYLTMLFDWQTGEKKASDARDVAAMHSQMGYFDSHQADKWDRAPLIPVQSALCQALGIDPDQRYVSASELSEARIQDPETDQEVSFVLWAGRLVRTDPKKQSPLEKAAVEAIDRLWTYQGLRMGRGLEVLPVKDSPDRHWISLAQLTESELTDQTDPTGGLRKVQQQFRSVQAAYRSGSPQEFSQATVAFLRAARTAGSRLRGYPSQKTIDLEVSYNRWAPFSIAWWLTSAAFCCLVLSMATRWKPLYVAALTAIVGSVLVQLAGFGIRGVVSGWVPVTNLYESVLCMALGTVVFGLVFGLLSRKQYVLSAALVVATIALVLADFCPEVLNPSIRPLPPVLRSKFWLAVHVITIMFSYSALAVSLGIGNITLGYHLAGSQKPETIRTLGRVNHESLKAGVLLLIAGTILGAMWADYSWGRFWGWDRKEVWALITLLFYLAVLHARYAGWVGNLGLAVFSVICFVSVVFTWYVVNLMGEGGLHNYAFSGGTGLFYVLVAVAVQLLYVGVAVTAAFSRRLSPA